MDSATFLAVVILGGLGSAALALANSELENTAPEARFIGHTHGQRPDEYQPPAQPTDASDD